MGNIRYELTEEEVVNFKPKFLYLTTSKYGQDWHSTPHYHPHTEIAFVTDGKGFFLLGEKDYPVKRGDLIIVNPNVLHTEHSDPDQPLNYVMIGVDNIAFDVICDDEEHAEEEKERTIFSFMRHFDRTNYYLQQLNKELLEKRPNYQLMSHHLLSILLLYVMRHANLRAAVAAGGDGFVSKECAFVRDYLNEHYAENITLDFLSGKTFINKFYLIHSFTRQFGVSPISYLIERRIKEAKFLLRNTHMSVTDIARATGFSSPSFFAKRFKQQVGVSPISYRNTADTPI